jgi:hypothetical protein
MVQRWTTFLQDMRWRLKFAWLQQSTSLARVPLNRRGGAQRVWLLYNEHAGPSKQWT